MYKQWRAEREAASAKQRHSSKELALSTAIALQGQGSQSALSTAVRGRVEEGPVDAPKASEAALLYVLVLHPHAWVAGWA